MYIFVYRRGVGSEKGQGQWTDMSDYPSDALNDIPKNIEADAVLICTTPCEVRVEWASKSDNLTIVISDDTSRFTKSFFITAGGVIDLRQST
jgi:hypothetical protein